MSNHEVAGFKFSVVGVAYAVLLAFVVIAVWDEYRRTDNAVRAEAERIYDLYRTSYTFPDSVGSEMRSLLLDYATKIRESEWQTMKKGITRNPPTAQALEKLSNLVVNIRPTEFKEPNGIQHAFVLMQQIIDYREERLANVGGTMTPVFWGVLLLGGLITLGYPSFFATSKIFAQTLMTTGLAAIIGLTFF